MRIVPEDSSSGSGDVKQFPVSRMLETAGNMMMNANNALTQHETTWKKVQSYIEHFPGFMQGPVRAVLDSYDRRLRDSYQWQMDFARALAQGADAADTTDSHMVQAFNNTNS
ncbi:MAG: hypothetical protein M3Z08_09770 [Chloroflexota bacterium]|nr:hypothetical protein [Chloroflexota bacterium]